MKKNKSKLILTVSLTMWLTFPVFAQVSISSPYSRYGLGELNFSKTSFLSSMSGTSVGLMGTNIINYSNPASYSAFREKSFLFDASALIYPRILKNDQTTEQTLFASLNNLQFAFPLAPKWGISLGVFPYSSIGYKLKNEEIIDSVGIVNYAYEGWGGLNTFYIGTGLEVVDGLSVGANMNYYFGNIDRVRIAVFDTTGFLNSRLTNKVNISDVNFNIGLQYRILFNKITESDGIKQKTFSGYSLTLGLNGGNAASLNAKENILAEQMTGSTPYATALDTVSFIENRKTAVNLPLSLSGGVFLEKQHRWMAGVDLNWQKWSDYSANGIQDSLQNTLRISAGGAIYPKEKPTGGMLQRSVVLLGAHYYNNYLELKNTPLTQYGISFGLAMPVRRTGTSLQISLELGKTGTTTNNLIEETYGKLRIGVSISETWFHRRKYD